MPDEGCFSFIAWRSFRQSAPAGLRGEQVMEAMLLTRQYSGALLRSI